MFTKTSIKQSAAKLIVSSLLPVAVLGSAMSVSTPSHAAECAPLSIVDIRPVAAQPIIVNGYTQGYSFRIQARVKNTNPRKTYIAQSDNQAHLSVMHTGRVVYKAPQHNSTPMTRNMSGGASRTITSATVELYKKPGQHALTATLRGMMFNGQCKQDYRAYIGVSDFKFDFTPISSGQQARRISARITGPNESSRPRPRPVRGTGAPAPRNRG